MVNLWQICKHFSSTLKWSFQFKALNKMGGEKLLKKKTYQFPERTVTEYFKIVFTKKRSILTSGEDFLAKWILQKILVFFKQLNSQSKY